MFTAPAFAQGTEAGPEAEVQDAPELVSEVGVELHAETSFPPFDSSTFPSQLLWLAITFGLFFLLLKQVVVPRIGGILEVRRQAVTVMADAALRAADLDEAAGGEQAMVVGERDAGTEPQPAEPAPARLVLDEGGQGTRDAAAPPAGVHGEAAEIEHVLVQGSEQDATDGRAADLGDAAALLGELRPDRLGRLLQRAGRRIEHDRIRRERRHDQVG